MEFELHSLPYSYSSLEPYIDAETMQIHYMNHYKAYLDKFNEAIQGVDNLERLSAEEIVANINMLIPIEKRKQVINNGGGYVNHNLYWESITPQNKELTPEITYELEKNFGSVEKFKEMFEKFATERFGSGWVFLVKDKYGNLGIGSYVNQDSPLTRGLYPLLALDVWEHAYYLNYKNNKEKYFSNFWNIVDWENVEKRLMQK